MLARGQVGSPDDQLVMEAEKCNLATARRLFNFRMRRHLLYVRRVSARQQTASACGTQTFSACREPGQPCMRCGGIVSGRPVPEKATGLRQGTSYLGVPGGGGGGGGGGGWARWGASGFSRKFFFFFFFFKETRTLSRKKNCPKTTT